jgi:hypothetical protein
MNLYAIHVASGEYIVDQAIYFEDWSLSFKAAYALRFFLPYTMRIKNGLPQKIWLGDDADSFDTGKLI